MFYRASTRMSYTIHPLFNALNTDERRLGWGLTLTQHGDIIKMIRQNPDGKMFVLTISIKDDGNLSCLINCTNGLDIELVSLSLRSFFIPVNLADSFTVYAYLADIRGNLREFFDA